MIIEYGSVRHPDKIEDIAISIIQNGVTYRINDDRERGLSIIKISNKPSDNKINITPIISNHINIK